MGSVLVSSSAEDTTAKSQAYRQSNSMPLQKQQESAKYRGPIFRFSVYKTYDLWPEVGIGIAAN
jgi:hypothetical protein